MKNWETLLAMNLVSQSLPLCVCACVGHWGLHHTYVILILVFNQLEEHETEGGEIVVGLKVEEEKEGDDEEEEEEEAPGNRRKCFSIDFPPGLVHLDSESQSTPGQTWTLIKNLLANRKSLKL